MGISCALVFMSKSLILMETVSTQQEKQSVKRGLACSTVEVRERVARAGGQSPHKTRGLEAASYETRMAIARKGGIARAQQRRRNAEKRAQELPPITSSVA